MDIQINWIEAVATILTFIAVYYIALPKRIGYHVATASQVFWIIFSISKGHYLLTIQASVLICVNFYAIYRWKKLGVGD